MLSVIIRTKNGEPYLLDVLRPLVAAAADGAVRDVVFFDTGSRDGTAMIADAAGAIMQPVPDDSASATGAALQAAHRADWVLMLDQATVLTSGWAGRSHVLRGASKPHPHAESPCSRPPSAPNMSRSLAARM